jgi:hypothetical protein
MIPGTFEDTKEMKLYATFSIPLIHGWLPPSNEAVHEALSRRAVSYEDAQNLLFREEELEEKLSGASQQGLTEEEQEIYQDIVTIKSFLGVSATQLTPWGLEVITKAIPPGTVAILFRNDHFSTLYRHPETLELLALVTDAGYAGHDEVVWESLVDVNGEHAEFFSGDFLVVGGVQQCQAPEQQHVPGGFPVSTASRDEGEWTNVQGHRSRTRLSPAEPSDPPLSPRHEQEDRDLALALQLQEEEDQRHLAEQARRRRESLLSEQYIEQQGRQGLNGLDSRGGPRGIAGRGGPPTAPHRRSSSALFTPATRTSSLVNNGRARAETTSNTPRAMGEGSRPTTQAVRSLLPSRNQGVSRSANDAVDDAPPSYEQAAKQRAYVPPAGHPSHPTSGLDGEGSASGAERAGSISVGPPGRLRPAVPPASAAGGREGKDRECVVM